MSVKALLPIVGVGSAFALYHLTAVRKPRALAAGRRPAGDVAGAGALRPRGVVSAGMGGGSLDDEELDPLPGAAPLTADFWDPAPDSRGTAGAGGPGLGGVPAHADGPSSHALPREVTGAPERSRLHADGSGETRRLDKDGWGAEWLARATQASDLPELDDPAEIPADSLSMISEASRHAACFEPFDAGPPSAAESPERRSGRP